MSTKYAGCRGIDLAARTDAALNGGLSEMARKWGDVRGGFFETECR